MSDRHLHIFSVCSLAISAGSIFLKMTHLQELHRRPVKIRKTIFGICSDHVCEVGVQIAPQRYFFESM
jgi:hypothetical protein